MVKRSVLQITILNLYAYDSFETYEAKINRTTNLFQKLIDEMNNNKERVRTQKI